MDARFEATRRARWMALGVAVLAAGCGSKIQDLAFVPGVSPGTGAVTFATNLTGEAHVSYVRVLDDSAGDSPSAPAADGRVPILGLNNGEKYEVTVVVDDGGKTFESDPLEIQIDPPDRDVIPLSVSTWNPDLACDPGGYVLFSYIGAESSGVAIVDREANLVFNIARPAEEQIARPRPGRDGKSILYNYADQAKIDDIANVVRIGLDGTELSETRTSWGHHDFVELPDGRIGWLAYDIREEEVPNDYGLGKVPVAGEVLYEGDEGMADGDVPTEVWNAWTDYPQGVYTIPADSRRNQPDWTDTSGCNNALLVPPEVPAFLPCAYEFAHANSLAYRESDDAYLFNWRWLDTLSKVDRATGALQWQWGGPFGDLVPGDTDTQAFEHGHFSDVWDGGMLMFDNRNKDAKSRLVEYAFDDATFTEQWSYESDAFENLLGDVRRFPIDGCDNVLVSWSGQGRISELTRDGTFVWDVTNLRVGDITSRLFYVPDLYDLSGVDPD